MQATKPHPSKVSPSHPRTRTMALAVTLAVAAFGFAGAMPALANDGGSLAEASANPTNVGNLAAADLLAPVITSSGLPGPIVSGETATITVSVGSSQLGSPAASGFVFLMVNGEALQASAVTDGLASFVIRPLAGGNDSQLSILYSGDDAYSDGTMELGALVVRPATANLSLYVPPFPAYAGGLMSVDATVYSEDSAQYGSPDGTIVLTLDGVEVGTAEVLGSNHIGRGFANLDEDLSAPDAQGTARFVVTNPSILLGSPDSFDLRAHFHPRNGFTEATHMPYSVTTQAARTSLQIHVGATADSATTVTGTTIVHAGIEFLDAAAGSAAPLSGTVRFYADGVLIGEVVAEPLGMAALPWTPKASGAVMLSAEFIPDTLNHVGSVQEAAVTVALPVVPDEIVPDELVPEKVVPAKVVPASSTTQKTELAATGANGSALMLGGSASILGAGLLALFLSRRRSNSTERR